jgi:hypothetical protein
MIISKEMRMNKIRLLLGTRELKAKKKYTIMIPEKGHGEKS